MAFAWDRAVLAVLRHSTLAAGESLRPVALGPGFGARHKLSLVAQFAAHQALLQFAGVADTEFDPAEWVVVRRRGADPRLVRVGGRVGSDDTPPLLTLVQQFADVLEIDLPILRQSWARADAVYADAFAQAPDEWARRSAYGRIASPGPDALRALKSGRYTYGDDECIESLRRYGSNVVVFRGESPLRRYSALGAYAGSESEVAEKIAAGGRRIYVVANEAAFDEGSRRVIEILMSLDAESAWILPGEHGLPETRHFVISPRLSARASLPDDRAWLEAFVQSDRFDDYLRHGDVPSRPSAEIAEPARSFLGALGVLGNRVQRDVATRFLAEFGFAQQLEELLTPGVCSIDGDELVFHADVATPTAAICRIAAKYVTDIDALHRFPVDTLSPELAQRYAHALIDRGRYRDAREIATLLPDHERELVHAKAERRTGDYSVALLRLDRMHRDDEARLLRAELLRLMQRHDEAAEEIAHCAPSDRVHYERALIAYESGRPVGQRPDDPYLRARLSASLQEADPAASLPLARTVPERIDALLDCMYIEFTAGRWTSARHLAIEALQLVGETQGDRAAGGILFLLAYLAADDGQIAQAQQHIARLRRFYGGTHDDLRLRELHLLQAQLDLVRGRLADARREALAIEPNRDQIAEAAALILDELDLLEHRNTKLRSSGNSGNVEFDKRHAAICTGQPPHGPQEVTQQDAAPDLTALRAAALRDFPYGPHDLGASWCFATRNRLGHWNVLGPHAARDLDAVLANGAVDWIVCSDRELLYVEGSHLWPPDSQDALGAIVRTRAENARLRRIAETEEVPLERITTDNGIIGDSPAIRELHARIARIAKRDVPVCILGESGTGKELVARAIHKSSTRRSKPFTAVNCAALPENLIESELFGHMRGAFTGADRDRAGLIETTDGGTLFLDEIGELPLPAQAKLLRFLQGGEFRRVGDTVNRGADVRVVSATNRKLEASVEEGQFREDLYYRIRGVELELPPLRERGSDVILLARHFLAAEREKHRGGAAAFSDEVEAIFTSYAWPGNVRELQNTIRAAHAMAGDQRAIGPEHLPERLRTQAQATNSYQDAVLRFRRDLIERSLAEAGGNQNRAAAILRMSRQSLAYQIRELGILVRKGNGGPTL